MGPPINVRGTKLKICKTLKHKKYQRQRFQYHYLFNDFFSIYCQFGVWDTPKTHFFCICCYCSKPACGVACLYDSKHHFQNAQAWQALALARSINRLANPQIGYILQKLVYKSLSCYPPITYLLYRVGFKLILRYRTQFVLRGFRHFFDFGLSGEMCAEYKRSEA